MKTGLIIFLLLLFSFSGCQNEDEDNTFIFDIEQNFRLYKDYTSANGVLVFELNELHDSRCPTGATCVWQGEARVSISLEDMPSDTLVLSTYDNLKDTMGMYSFELIDVKPYPDVEKAIEPNDYVVTLVISEIS